MGEVERLHLGLVERVTRWAGMLLAGGVCALVVADARAAAGLALGGGVSLGLLMLYRALARWLTPGRRGKWMRGVFWMVWLAKWPALGMLLYLALSRGWVRAGWLCAGAGLVPAVATGLAVKAVWADGWRRLTQAGANP